MAGAGPTPLETDRVGRFVPTPHEAPHGVSCPVCGIENPRSRELCVRCGVDLETGAVLPQPRPGHGRARPDGPRPAATPHRAWWVAPIAIVGVAGAILAGLWYAGIGPFASEPELPAATFAPERYPVDDDPLPLLLSDIATLTTRAPQGSRTFPVEQMVDTNPETAWHSEPDDLPAGVDEMIDLFLETPAWISQIVINNGDHADPAAYEETGRIQRAEVVMDGDVRMEMVLLDLGREPQAVTLPEPVLTTTLRLEIVEVLPGTLSESLAVSDLELRGWPADPTDADLAHRRADARQDAGSFTLPG